MRYCPSSLSLLLLLFVWTTAVVAVATTEKGDNDKLSEVVGDLLKRVLPTGDADDDDVIDDHFHFALLDDDDCGGKTKPLPCFQLKQDDDENDGRLIRISGTTISEVTAGLGFYLRHICNMTIGWSSRTGGSHVFIPSIWPVVGPKPIRKRRIVPWSYLMNVCTHSYTLVWYNWEEEWEHFIDWLSLSGINNILALTGQEEIQYKVFRKLGLADKDIRTWFNGPAFMTWSRGQNEYGNNICGPLPRQWMKEQWKLQKTKILPRLRELGIVGQLPGFQGNVPIQLKTLYNDTNITKQGATGWIDSLDPLFTKIAKLWMETLIEDFGTDHWYQLDGYFNGGTAPWRRTRRKKSSLGGGAGHSSSNNLATTTTTSQIRTTKRGLRLLEEIPHDDAWFRRGVAAYKGLNSTDPDAIWSFQGFSFVHWSTAEEASYIKGFIDSAPPHKFVIIDMGYDAQGQWKQWNNASFFGASFIWTTLHNFGDTDGIKGDMRRLNNIPFEAVGTTSIVGSGATPEGLDQNPAYYEFLFDQPFRKAPVHNLTAHMIRRNHQRYGLQEFDRNVASAWALLVSGLYSTGRSVQDTTGIAHLRPRSMLFEDDRYTPQPFLCKTVGAWRHMIDAATTYASSGTEPFWYDVVNLGREVLAQLSTPAALNFSDATARKTLDKEELVRTGSFYMSLLADTDSFVATNKAFLLGPWLESARRWNSTEDGSDSFFEWNARTQITTWIPVPRNSPKIPGGPLDYAAKHWSGLIQDYYVPRAGLLLKQALSDADKTGRLNQTKVDRLFAEHAFQWTTSTEKTYPSEPTGDTLQKSHVMWDKYQHWFSTCG